MARSGPRLADFAASSLRPFPQDSIRNHEALRGADAVCQIRRQLLKMSDVESVDSIATCFLFAQHRWRASQIRPPIHPRSAHSCIVSRYISGVRVTI